jgi:hypothetical protein
VSKMIIKRAFCNKCRNLERVSWSYDDFDPYMKCDKCHTPFIGSNGLRIINSSHLESQINTEVEVVEEGVCQICSGAGGRFGTIPQEKWLGRLEYDVIWKPCQECKGRGWSLQSCYKEK